MSLKSSIRIEVFPKNNLPKIYDALLSGGWSHYDSMIHFSWSTNDLVVGDKRIVEPISEWIAIKQKTEDKIILSVPVGLLLVDTNNIDAEFWIHDEKSITIYLGPSRPRLSGNNRFTDFSMLLNRVIPILTNLQFTILRVNCDDDNY